MVSSRRWPRLFGADCVPARRTVPVDRGVHAAGAPPDHQAGRDTADDLQRGGHLLHLEVQRRHRQLDGPKHDSYRCHGGRPAAVAADDPVRRVPDDRAGDDHPARPISRFSLRAIPVRLAEAVCHRAGHRASRRCTPSTAPYFAPATSRTSTSSIRWCPSTSSRVRSASLPRRSKPYVQRQQKDIEMSAQRARRPATWWWCSRSASLPGERTSASTDTTGAIRIPSCSKSTACICSNAVATRASTLYALPKILEKNGIKLTTVVSRAGIPTCLLRELHAVRQLRGGGRNEGQRLRSRRKVLRRRRDPAAEGKPAGPTPPVTASSSCTWAVAATARLTAIGIRLSSSNSSQCVPMPTWPTSARSRSSTTRTTTPFSMSTMSWGRPSGRSIALRRSVRLHLSVRSWRVVDGRRHDVSWHAAGHVVAGGAGGDSVDREIFDADFDSQRAEYQQPDVFDTVLDLFSIQSTTFDRAGSFIDKGAVPARGTLEVDDASLRADLTSNARM